MQGLMNWEFILAPCLSWLCPPDPIPLHPLTPARYGLCWNQKPTAVRRVFAQNPGCPGFLLSRKSRDAAQKSVCILYRHAVLSGQHATVRRLSIMIGGDI